MAHISLILGSVGFMSYKGVILSERPVLGRESKHLLFPTSRQDLLK